jgi:ELWxxDGT repeat protein
MTSCSARPAGLCWSAGPGPTPCSAGRTRHLRSRRPVALADEQGREQQRDRRRRGRARPRLHWVAVGFRYWSEDVRVLSKPGHPLDQKWPSDVCLPLSETHPHHLYLTPLEDRTAPSASLIAELNRDPNFADPFVVGGITTAWQLWRADGTAAGGRATDRRHRDDRRPTPGPAGRTERGCFFVAPEEGIGLRGVDGATGVVQRILAPDPGVGNAAVGDLTVLNGRLYFTTTTAGSEVGRDARRDGPGRGPGTRAGRFPPEQPRGRRARRDLARDDHAGRPGAVADRPGGPGSGRDLRRPVPDRVVGVACQPRHPDRSSSRTQCISGCRPTGCGGPTVRPPEPRGSAAPRPTRGNWRSLTGHYFVAGSAAAGRELWRSDGTPGGTAVLAVVYPGSIGSNINSQTIAGGLLYFKANYPNTGIEMCVSDGTPAGTRILADLNPGTGHAVIDDGFFVSDETGLFPGQGVGGTGPMADRRDRRGDRTVKDLASISARLITAALPDGGFCSGSTSTRYR